MQIDAEFSGKKKVCFALAFSNYSGQVLLKYHINRFNAMLQVKVGNGSL